MPDHPQVTTVQARIPTLLLAELQSLVDAGWFQSLDELIPEALRRFAEAHRGELTEKFLREDVEWGLRGTD
jgi:Arc/MetJ-type ribon-helix-helix transcriptional regulator